jgi:diacylglycerol kinase family enzyme
VRRLGRLKQTAGPATDGVTRAEIEVIVNVGSGGGVRLELRRHLAQAFRALGVDARISFADGGADLVKLARRAARGDAERIVAGGGDGTLNAVAAAIIAADKALGVLPFGTLNHFAKDLGIPLDLESAVGAIVAGHEIRVDVGEVNGHIFLNNASLGLYPRVVRERERQQRLGWSKGPAAVWAAFAVLRRHPFLDIRLNVGGQSLTGRTPFLFVGNNEYAMERLTIGSRASLDKGRLSVYATSRLGRWGLLRLALRALAGGLRQERDLLAFATTDLLVETRRSRVRMALDGEVIVLRPPLHYAIRPRALRVLAPAAGP